MNTQRILAVLAAALFVGAAALATVTPEMPSLALAVGYVSVDAVGLLHVWLDRAVGDWAWAWVAQPLMVRPAWIPFGSLGLIFAGLSLSMPPPGAARRSHRRS